jgi:hypothetical protein
MIVVTRLYGASMAVNCDHDPVAEPALRPVPNPDAEP